MFELYAKGKNRYFHSFTIYKSGSSKLQTLETNCIYDCEFAFFLSYKLNFVIFEVFHIGGLRT